MKNLRSRAKLAAALMGMVMLMVYPEEAAQAARQAMQIWASSFAPALFVFFLILPALSTPEALSAYEKLFSGVTGRLFGCPGRAAGAIMVSWMAGSPAGATALKRAKGGMTRGELSRAAVVVSALSPGFLVGSVGAGMLGSPSAGYILAKAQLLSLIAGALLMRRAWAGDDRPVAAAVEQGVSREGPVFQAVRGVLTVCGYMVGFAVLARLVSCVIPAADAFLLPLLEVTGGGAQLAGALADFETRLLAIAAVCGLGGLSILTQNLNQLPEAPWWRLALGKLLHAALMTLFTYVQLRLPSASLSWPLGALETALLLASLLLIGTAIAHFASRGRSEKQHNLTRSC